MELMMWVVAAVLTVVAVTSLAPKVGVAAPLLLVVVGVVGSLVPAIPTVHIQPEWILAAVLPPLLYSAAANVPTTDFRRDLRTISALSIVLVIASALLVGAVASFLVPGLPLAAGIALGAIVSPTDAVATSLVRRAGVSPRIVTVLEGESLLNDASALVLLRAAVAAIGGTVAFGHVALDFVWAVVGAVVIGWVVGELNLVVRRAVPDPAASITVTVVAPYVAYLPAEHLGASGLVAAVMAGLVTGYGSLRMVGAEDRLMARAVWSTIELVLEGMVFLLMGLQMSQLLTDVHDDHGQIAAAVWLGVAAATLVVAVRFVFLGGFVFAVNRLVRDRSDDLRIKLDDMSTKLDSDEFADPRFERRKKQVQRRIVQKFADLDYFAAERFGWRDVSVMTWAGMRGAVTVAAAQSLPFDTPQRSLLVLAAYFVAAGTLIVQGSTLSMLVGKLGLTGIDSSELQAERQALDSELNACAIEDVLAGTLRRPDGTEFSPELLARAQQLRDAVKAETDAAQRAVYGAELTDLRILMIESRRRRLAEIRDLGTISSEVLSDALAELDAEQLSLQLRADHL